MTGLGKLHHVYPFCGHFVTSGILCQHAMAITGICLFSTFAPNVSVIHVMVIWDYGAGFVPKQFPVRPTEHHPFSQIIQTKVVRVTTSFRPKSTRTLVKLVPKE